ncbi:phytanoyl-CoA-dioxygenase [Prochlorococcus phage P-SSM2]|uniref:Phytanoyl-CoA-dioxygenase n=2 Tax=Salacisavirus pssm2 TaxID=2734140 RepID=Q58ML8_BPPRM|nr:2OG-Fe(II) oxygenase [Prochlorococcus phage P-SSM2]AAX44514.1 phytanoyl-CoA-dioxygenase [Prochlorococcus phage P-SSM2]ACY76015.1 conserved hypothetical protein [Prochlorococcus phage P-SSM2]AGN12452.1 hypothetical protein PRTG_00305 [Prochlorococcus phage P-SSM5]
MKIDHQPLFPTPLFEITGLEIDNEKLAKDIYDLQKKDEGVKDGYSNWGGWHSKAQYGNEIDEIFKPLIDSFIKLLPDFGFNPKITEVCNLVLWANINPKGSYNTTHNHPGCDLSGVYYVKVPEGECGNINFLDPRPALNYGNSFIVERYVGGDSVPRYPVEGNMYVFPSSLQHSVGTNLVDDDRISIAFNLNVR